MGSVVRSIVAVLAGMVVFAFLVMAIEAVGMMIFPPPPGTDMANPEAARAAMANAPVGSLLFVLLAWIVGTFAGAWTAARIARRAPVGHGLVVGVLGLAGAIANMLMIPHPVWFWVLGVAVFLPVAWLGARIAAAAGRSGGSPRPAL